MSWTYVPFWLKSHPCFYKVCRWDKWRMNAQTPIEDPDAGLNLLWGAFVLVFLTGFVVGVKVTLWFGRWCIRPESSPATCLTPAGWRSVVIRALRFLRRRRHVALAFNNYKNKPLRQLPVTDWPRRALDPGEPVTPLREGPAINGSIRRRA